MTDLDLDIWRYGRNAAQAGRLDNKMLRACYPYIEVDYRQEMKISTILHEYFKPDNNGVRPYLHRRSYVFFQTWDDAHFFNGLLHVY